MKKSKRGGARPGSGRKPGTCTADDPRSVSKSQRYTAREFSIIGQAAARAGVSQSEFIRKAVLDAATEVNSHAKKKQDPRL